MAATAPSSIVPPTDDTPSGGFVDGDSSATSATPAPPVIKINKACHVRSRSPKIGGAKKKVGKKRGGEELIVECVDTVKESVEGFAGGADIKTRYKKTLNKKTVEDLRKMAKGKGIKITTKKDGKSAYLKKSSIINKLCDMKHPKKTVKKTTKRK